MKSRNLLACSVLGLALGALPASAAVSVLGAGLAQSCYKSAEFNGDPDSGIATCTMALEQQALTPVDRAATYINRGILRARKATPEAALTDYDTGLRMNPDLAEGYVDRGATYIALHRYKEALADIDRGLKLGAKKPHIAYYDRAIANEALGDIRGAYHDYKKAVELAPDFDLAKQQLRRFKVVRRPGTDGI